MILSLDTSRLKTVRLRSDHGSKTRRATYRIYADAALPKIAGFFKSARPSALAVVTETGAWSATRTGVALVNALAYAWRLPVAAITRERFDADGPIPPGRRAPVAVRYDAPPNITAKKTRS
jgi:hypothetical protein